MDSRYIKTLVALDRLQKGTMEYQQAAEAVDEAIEMAVAEERERCVRRVIEVLSQVPPPNARPLDWRWVLNPASSGGPLSEKKEKSNAV